MKSLVFSFVVALCGALVASDTNVTSALDGNRTREESLTVLQIWQRNEKNLKRIVNNFLKQILPDLMRQSYDIELSQRCTNDLLKVIVGIRNLKTWAFALLDATGKPMDGILSGVMASFGSYDQCVNLVVHKETRRKDSPKEEMFKGQYCGLDIRPPLPPKPQFYKLEEVLDELKEFSQRDTVLAEGAKYAHFFYFLSLRFGVCVPSSCSFNDMTKITTAVSNQFGINASVSFCEVKQKNEFKPIHIAVITGFSFLGLLMLIGTILDMYEKKMNMKFETLPARILLCFSFVMNTKKIFNTKTSSDRLAFLHGFRFLTIAWIILGHTYLNINFLIFRGLEAVKAFAKDFAFQAVINATVAVDTFFFIGGLLVVYVAWNAVVVMKKPFNIKLYIFHRFWRLTPTHMAVVIFIFLAPLFGSGPVWHDTVDRHVDACYENWWTNLLYINNFIHPDRMCLPQSWYIACDMQLYIFCLVILIPLLKWPKIGLTINVICILLSIVSSGVVTYMLDYPPTMLFVHPDPEQRISYWAYMYFLPYPHLGPYCVGMMFGYFLATRPKITLKPIVQIVGWCLAIACNMNVLYGVFSWNGGRDPTLVETILYSMFHRTGWTLGVAWVSLVCAYGYGGWVNVILSWKGWIPLGRLTYMSYLIHPLVQIASVGSVREEITPSHYFAVWIYFGYLCATLGIAYCTSILVEAPLLGLEKLFLSPNDSDKTKNLKENNAMFLTNGEDKIGVKNNKISEDIPIVENCHVDIKNGAENNGFIYRL